MLDTEKIPLSPDCSFDPQSALPISTVHMEYKYALVGLAGLSASTISNRIAGDANSHAACTEQDLVATVCLHPTTAAGSPICVHIQFHDL